MNRHDFDQVGNSEPLSMLVTIVESCVVTSSNALTTSSRRARLTEKRESTRLQTHEMSSMHASDRAEIRSDAPSCALVRRTVEVVGLSSLKRGCAMKMLDPWTWCLGPRPCLVAAPLRRRQGIVQVVEVSAATVRTMARTRLAPGPPMFRMRTHHETKQNLTLAFSFNGVGVAAVVTGFDIPAWAMIAMV